MNKYHVAVSGVLGISAIATAAILQGFDSGFALAICSILGSIVGSALGFAFGRAGQ